MGGYRARSGDLGPGPCRSDGLALGRHDAAGSFPPARRRKRAHHAAFPPALCRHAGCGGGQYRPAIGDAGHRAGDRHLGLLGDGFLHLVGGAVGDACPFLGAAERPAWTQGADLAWSWRLHCVDDPVRAGAACRAQGRACRRPDLRHLRHLPRAIRLARLRDPKRDPGLSCFAHPPVGSCRGAVGIVQQLQPRNDRRPGAGPTVRAADRGPRRPAVRIRRHCGGGVRRNPRWPS